MSSLGQLVVSLTANIAEFTSDLGKAAHVSEKRMEEIKRGAERAGKAVGAMFVAGTATAAVLVKQAIDSADAMSKLSQSAGVGIETLSTLGYAANLSGVNVESLGTAMGKLSKNMMDTAAGTGEAIKAFDAMNISVKKSDGTLKSADAVMLEVADQFAGMEDGAGKTALAMQIFGKAGAAMIPMLNQGSAGIRQMQEEAALLGQTITGETGRAAEAFNDNLSRLNTVKQGIANTVMRELLPSLNQLTDGMVESAKNAGFMDTAARAAATGLRILFTGAAVLVGTFKAIGESWGALAASFALIAQGEFSKAWDVMKQGATSFNDTITNTMITVQDIWTEAATNAENNANRVAKAAAPIIANEKELAALKKEQARATKEAAKAQQDFEDLMAKGAMKRLQMEDEANQRAEEAYQKKREILEGSINGIMESLLTEEEAERESYTRRLEALIEANELRIITDGEMIALREQMEEQHQKRMGEIIKRSGTEIQKFEQKTMVQRAQTIFGELANITAGVSQHSRALFNLNKVAGIANAVINAYVGISKTLATYPYPWNLALAAAHGVAAFAQVNAIRSQSFGGGGAAPSLAGSTAASPVTPVTGGAPDVLGSAGQPQQQQAPRQVTINIQGRTIDRAQLEELVNGMNELMEDGFPARFKLAAAS